MREETACKCSVSRVTFFPNLGVYRVEFTTCFLHGAYRKSVKPTGDVVNTSGSFGQMQLHSNAVPHRASIWPDECQGPLRRRKCLASHAAFERKAITQTFGKKQYSRTARTNEQTDLRLTDGIQRAFDLSQILSGQPPHPSLLPTSFSGVSEEVTWVKPWHDPSSIKHPIVTPHEVFVRHPLSPDLCYTTGFMGEQCRGRASACRNRSGHGHVECGLPSLLVRSISRELSSASGLYNEADSIHVRYTRTQLTSAS